MNSTSLQELDLLCSGSLQGSIKLLVAHLVVTHDSDLLIMFADELQIRPVAKERVISAMDNPSCPLVEGHDDGTTRFIPVRSFLCTGGCS